MLSHPIYVCSILEYLTNVCISDSGSMKNVGMPSSEPDCYSIYTKVSYIGLAICYFLWFLLKTSRYALCHFSLLVIYIQTNTYMIPHFYKQGA